MTVRHVARQLVGLLCVFSFTGCFHVGANLARMKQVKSAAIIAYTGQVDITEQRAEYNNGASIGGTLSAVQGLSDVGSAETAARRAQEGQETYDALVKKLSDGLGWHVLSRQEVVGNPAVQKLFADKMQDRAVNKGFRFGVDKVIWQEMGSLSQEDQQALKTALGVDVLLAVKVQVKQGRIYGYGVGQDGAFDVWPKGILTVAAYDGGEGGAIWNEPWVEGANTTGKLKRVMGVNETKDEAKLVLEATELAADALIAKYQQANGTVATATPASP